MSVAPEFPPAVSIPDRARRRPDRRLGSSRSASRGHLRLVDAQVDSIVALPANAPARLAAPPDLSSIGTSGRVLPSPTGRPLKLTARGLRVLWSAFAAGAVMLLLVAYLSWPTPPVASVSSSGVVTVQTGDTLWSIASRIAPNRDPRAVVDELMARNHLSAADLVPGQQLRLR